LTAINGRACLLARRLSEAGVRFVQVEIDGWDHHGNIRENLPRSCVAMDQPVAGLLWDLKGRGLKLTYRRLGRDFRLTDVYGEVVGPLSHDG